LPVRSSICAMISSHSSLYPQSTHGLKTDIISSRPSPNYDPVGLGYHNSVDPIESAFSADLVRLDNVAHEPLDSGGFVPTMNDEVAVDGRAMLALNVALKQSSHQCLTLLDSPSIILVHFDGGPHGSQAQDPRLGVEVFEIAETKTRGRSAQVAVHDHATPAHQIPYDLGAGVRGDANHQGIILGIGLRQIDMLGRVVLDEDVEETGIGGGDDTLPSIVMEAANEVFQVKGSRIDQEQPRGGGRHAVVRCLEETEWEVTGSLRRLKGMVL
jgi:hypothetical protein